MQTKIRNAREYLIELAREVCWNELATDKSYYVITTINPDSYVKNRLLRVIIRNLLLTKRRRSITEVSNYLDSRLNDIYLIELHVLKAKSDSTIFEVAILYKSALDTNFRQQIKDESPAIYQNITMPPPNHPERAKEKFDINWQLAFYGY
ncbi:hypothetical protein [Lewinella cohaerens]|uniref:hypothetical protein n=1 Tax=Lewinella cohaerens TaxID=70995 RepID=UPI00036C41D7|nr:hypothetical protein [Lewinella cohaerens]